MSIGENKYPILFFILAFVIYGINTCIQFSSDVKPAALLPFLILKHHTLYFDAVIPHISDPQYGWGSLFNLVYVNGHYLSAYPIVTPVLLIPVYIIHMLLIMVFPGGWEYYSVLSKSCASLLVATAVMLFYMVCNRMFEKRTAIITTIVFAFGTLTWAVSSQTLWQHDSSELLLVIAILCIVKNEQEENIRNFVILGVAGGLLLFNRPPDFIMFIPVLYYVWLHRENIYAFLFWFSVSAVPFLIYNITMFGSIFGGYDNIAVAYSTSTFPVVNSVISLMTLLISPNRGLFVYSPVLLFAIWGVWKCKNKVLLWFVPVCFLTAYFYSVHLDNLAGGWCYGPRYLCALLPVLCLFVGYAIEKMDRKWWAVFTVLLVFSICVQAIGAWGYPFSEWNQRSDLTDRSRVWDTQDIQIVDSFWAIQKTETVSVFIWPTLPPPIGYWVLWEKGDYL